MFSGIDLRHSSLYVCVLWGEYFDETATVIFVSQLRQVGLRVKVIGLTGQRSSGRHKLELYADMTLGEALLLNTKATCIIVPCSEATMRKFKDDPRLSDFLQQTYTPLTRIVLQETNTIFLAILQHFAVPPEQILIYKNIDDLIEFAQQLAKTLSTIA